MKLFTAFTLVALALSAGIAKADIEWAYELHCKWNDGKLGGHWFEIEKKTGEKRFTWTDKKGVLFKKTETVYNFTDSKRDEQDLPAIFTASRKGPGTRQLEEESTYEETVSIDIRWDHAAGKPNTTIVAQSWDPAGGYEKETYENVTCTR